MEGTRSAGADGTATVTFGGGWLARLDATGLPLLAARLLVGGAFVVLALAKIRQPPGEFLKLIEQYGLLPHDPPVFLNLAAVVIPWVELLCGLALLAGVMVRGAAALLALMLVAFTGAIVLRTLEIQQAQHLAFCAVRFDCGCGTGVVLICRKLAENAALLLLSVVALLSNSRRFCLAGWLARRATPPLP